jgi:hypothetical protein
MAAFITVGLYQGIRVVTDGTNYNTQRGLPGRYLFNIGDFAACDGSTDMTSAIQGVYNMVDGSPSAVGLNGSEIDWPSTGPKGACVISSTIALQSFTAHPLSEIVVKGGPVIWAGSTSVNAFEIDNCFHCTFENFYLKPQMSAMNAIGTAFLIQQLATTTCSGTLTRGTCGVSSGNLFLNNYIDGVYNVAGTGGGVNICFEQAVADPLNDNPTNDQMQFYGNNCRFQTSYSWQLDGATNFSDVFVGNFSLGVTTTMAKVNTSFGAVNDEMGAQFTWIGGQTNASAVADFVIASNAGATESQNAVVIKGDWSENSDEFVIVNNGSPNNIISPVTLEDDSVFTPDFGTHCVTDNTPGPLTVSGGSYGMGGVPCDFYMNPSTGSPIWGKITTVAMTGVSMTGGSNVVPILNTTATTNYVEVADNVYTVGAGAVASPPMTPEVANFAGNLQTPEVIGPTTLTITSTGTSNAVVTKPGTDSTTAMLFETAGGTTYETHDSTNKRVRIGDSTAPTATLDVVGKFVVNSSGRASRIDNFPTAVSPGIGMPNIIGQATLTAQTSTVTTTNLVSSTPTTGTYLLLGNITCTAGTGTVTVTLNWTDTGSVAHTLTSSSATCPSGYINIAPYVRLINGSAVTYSATASGTVTFDVTATALLLGSI